MFELSMSLSWDYLWVMDDDVYPEPDCLTNLLKYIGKDAGVCIPSRSDGRYEDEVVVGINLKVHSDMQKREKCDPGRKFDTGLCRSGRYAI